MTRSRETTTAELLKDGVIEIGDGYRAKNAEFVGGGGLPFVRVADVNTTIRQEGLDELPLDQISKYGPKVSRPFDSLITMKGTVGEVAYVLESNRPFVYSPQLSYWRSRDPKKVHPRWLRYWLESPEFLTQAAATKSATDMADYINLRDQRKMRITLPPPSLQHQIAEVLGSMDDLIENNRRRSELLEQMARAIYREWFVHFRYPGHEDVPLVDSPLGPIPRGWNLTTVSEALTALGGGTPSKEQPTYWQGGTIPWFTPSDLTKARTRYSPEPELCITGAGLAKSSARLFPPGSVLMTSRATLGVLTIAKTSATTNQGFIVIPPDERWSPSFIREWLAYKADDLAAVATGATFREITKGAFKRIPFTIPEQSVLDAYRASTDPIEGSVRRFEEQIGFLADLRDLLLPKLVTGEIDVSGLNLDALVESVA